MNYQRFIVLNSERKMEKEEFCVSVEEEISQIIMERPHVVILGAGASRAAALEGDVHGRIVPLMNDPVEIVGLDKILIKWDISFEEKNFESIYSRIHEDESKRVSLFENEIPH